MAKVTLTIEVDPELRRRVKLAAQRRGETMREWIVRAIERGLDPVAEDDLIMPAPGAKPIGIANPASRRADAACQTR